MSSSTALSKKHSDYDKDSPLSFCRSAAEFKGKCKTVKLFAKHMKVMIGCVPLRLKSLNKHFVTKRKISNGHSKHLGGLGRKGFRALVNM